MATPLQQSVDVLVRPQNVPTLQSTGDQAWVTTVRHPPLLAALEAATVGSIGSAGGAASGGNDSSRLPFDAAAVALRDSIRAVLAGWIGPRAVRGSLQHALVTWYRLHRDAIAQGIMPPEQARSRERVVESWPQRIRDLYEPPEQFTLPEPCPHCGERWGIDPASGDRVDALAVTYRRPSPDSIADVLGRCRACRHEWPGTHGLRVLQQECDEAQQRQPLAFDTPARP